MDGIEIQRLLEGRHHNPFELLSWQKSGDKNILRVFMPGAEAIKVFRIPVKGMPEEKQSHQRITKKNGGKPFLLRPQGKGIFQRTFDERFFYVLEIIYDGGMRKTQYDPYYFRDSLFTPLDLYLFNEGTHTEAYKKMGARRRIVENTPGYNFSVWAPNALGVSVSGDFNGWDGRLHQMKSLGNSGIWEIFMPGIEDGVHYKFEIRSNTGRLLLKSDPFATAFQMRPDNASVTFTSSYKWQHGRLTQESMYNKPLAIYEMHLGSWKKNGEKNFLNYRDIAESLVPYLKDTGFNWVEFLPVTEHPFDSSWGYQTTGFFAPTSRHGTPDDFRFLIDRLHENEIGVILDWSPAHFPKDDFALYMYDGTHLYEHDDPKKGEHPDWKSSIFNYGRKEVCNFLINSAAHWVEEYNIDALRVDGVASMLYLDYSRKEGDWIPNIQGGRENLEAVEFLKKLNIELYSKFPGVFTIAEESTSWPMVSRPVYAGGLGFGFKWNMGWMHDTLYYFSLDPVHRKFHHNCLTFSFLYAFSENFVLTLSHDEVVYGKKSLLHKMPGDRWQKFANLRLLLLYMYCHPGKKMLFMGSEFGQSDEWCHSTQLQWKLLEKKEHGQLKKFVTDINTMYKREKSLFEVDFEPCGFQWIDIADYEKSIVSFMRKGRAKNDFIIAAFNFTPVPREKYRIGVPLKGCYGEICNSDSAFYGGSDTGNAGTVMAEKTPCHNHPYSLCITLPPLAGIVLKPSTE